MCVWQVEQLLSSYEKGSSSDIRITSLRAIGCSSNPEVIEKVLNILTSGERIKNQDAYIPLAGVRGTRAGCDAAWQHLLANWDVYLQRFPPGLSLLKHLIKDFCEGMSTPEQLSKFTEFFAERDTAGFDSAVRQVTDVVQSRISWVARDSEDVANWLKSNGYLA